MESEIYGYIYLIKNTVNGKVYVGQTVNGFDRRYHNNWANNTHNSHLKRSVEIYGQDSFIVEKEYMTAYSLEELNQMEVDLIQQMKSHEPKFGYNKTFGGDSVIHTEETRKKISEATKGKIVSDESRRKMSESHIGKTATEETKKKISEALKGRIFTGEHKKNLSEAKTGEKNHKSKPVVQLHKITGELVVRHPSARSTGLTSQSISKCCNGKHKSAHGFKWMFEDDYLKQQQNQEQTA